MTFILLLIIGPTLVVYGSIQSVLQTDYSIKLRGYILDHSAISISILPQENETWWEPSYLNASLHGINQWNDALQDFARIYTDFSYLSNVHLVPTVSHELVSDFDIYVVFRAEYDNERIIGETITTTQTQYTIENSTVYISVKAPSGHIMTEVDVQNILVHEIGHTVGLSHSNYSRDVMYPTVYYQKTVKPVSSLDLYALSQIFAWMTNSTQLSSSIICPEKSVLTMPSNINYVYAQIDANNLPVSSPQNLIESAIESLLRPEPLTLFIVMVTLITSTVIILKRLRKPQIIF